MYPVFGIRGATYFLGVAEWVFGALLFAGFWNKKLGILGALGFIATSTIIPFMPDGWAVSAGGISGNDGARRLPNERHPPSYCILLFVETRRSQSRALE